MISSRIDTSGQLIPPLQSGQQGISLIDALIALVIFSVGLLAVAALQSVSKQSNYEAMQRTNASVYAYDLIERMRMNSDALADYLGDTILTDTHTPCTSCTTVSAVAANDLYEWKGMVLGETEKDSADASVGGLVNPSVCLSGPGTRGEYTLAIAWRGQASIPVTGTPANTCGSGKYDNTAGDYAYRRILVLNTYIGQ
jgi:type IV pilus assembly protein PilV